MSDKKHDDNAFRIPANNGWAHAWKMALAVAVLGLLMAAVGWNADHRRFAFSWLMGFATVMTMGLGALFFVILQHLTGAGWSITVRRSAEFFTAGLPIVFVLIIPIWMNAGTLFSWWNLSHETPVAHAQEHAEHEGHDAHGAAAHEEHGEHGGEAHAAGHHDANSPLGKQHHEILGKKATYLSQTFFYVRGVIILLAWLWLSVTFFRNSTAQDKDGKPEWTVKSARIAPVATMVFALSLTFGAFDWIMSLEPTWYSTMFGVRWFGASAVLGLALIILMCLGFRRAGIVKEEINVEHLHDLGKLMFGFLVFWAYASFCEFFLIWYAAIPEETAYYHRRWDFESWRMVSLSIVVVKFIVPFWLIMSRNAKRNLGLLGFGAGWIAAMHIVEMYYCVMPYYAPDQEVPFSIMGAMTDAGCIMACVGLYLTVVFKRMLNHPVIPVRDPRLSRALDFVQV